MISLDQDIVGGIEVSNLHCHLQQVQDMQEEANAKAADAPAMKKKKKKRGGCKIQMQLQRKQKNVVDKNTVRLQEACEQEKMVKERERKAARGKAHYTPKETAPLALKRFY